MGSIINPRGRGASFIRRSLPIIDSILGNIGDIRVKKSLNETLTELEGFKKERDDQVKYETMKSALNSVKLSESDLYKPSGDFSITDDDKTIQNTNAYKDYAKMIEDNNAKVNEGSDPTLTLMQATPESFKKFVTDNPNYYQELVSNKNIKQQVVPIAPEELDQLYYTKAGIKDPNDVKFFQEYRKNKDKGDSYNERLMRFVYGKEDELTSPGSLGNSQYKRLLNFAGLLKLSPKDEAKEDPLKKLTPDKWKIGTYDNKPYWYADVYDDKTRQWTKQYIQPLTAEEVKKNKLEQKKKLSDFTIDDFKNIGYDDLIKNYSATDLYNNFSELPKEFQDKLYETFPDWKEEDMKLTKTGSTRRRKLGRLKLTTVYDSDLKVMSDIGLKYKESGKPYDEWEEKDRAKYEERANKILALNPDKTIEDIWSMVGDFESRKYKKTPLSKLKQGELGNTGDSGVSSTTGMTVAQEWTEVQKIYNQLVSAVQSGTMKEADAITSFSKWYKNNKSLLHPEVVAEIEKLIDQYL